MKQLDEKMAQWLTEKTQLEASLIDGSLSGPDMAQHGKRLKDIGEALDQAEERWLELGGWIEDAQSQAAHTA